MLKKEEILSYLASKKAEFGREFQVTKIGLFGSYAMDTPQTNSDIDIIIEFEPLELVWDVSTVYLKKWESAS